MFYIFKWQVYFGDTDLFILEQVSSYCLNPS